MGLVSIHLILVSNSGCLGAVFGFDFDVGIYQNLILFLREHRVFIYSMNFFYTHKSMSRAN